MKSKRGNGNDKLGSLRRIEVGGLLSGKNLEMFTMQKRSEMTAALERIRELTGTYFPESKAVRIAKRWGVDYEDFKFLLKAFQAMREIAISKSYDPWSHGEKHYDRKAGRKEINEEFEKIMLDTQSRIG